MSIVGITSSIFIHHFIYICYFKGRLPPEILRQRYAGLFLLSLVLRLSKEADRHTRQMTRFVLMRILTLVDNEDARTNLLKVVVK